MGRAETCGIDAAIESGSFFDDPDRRWKVHLRDGTTVLVRSIRRDDAEIERRFIERLSPRSRRYRFLGVLKNPSSEFLQQMTQPDPEREVALVALIAEGAEKREIGVARFNTEPGNSICECAVVVSDEWQGRGLATILMQHLIAIARKRGIECMYSIDAADNNAMRDLAAHLGFERKADPNDVTQILHVLDLKIPTV